MKNDKEKLYQLIKAAGIDHAFCNSDGKPLSTYRSLVVDEELQEPFTDYLIKNGVTFKSYVKDGVSMTKVEKEVVLAYADNDMDASKAGRATNYHRNSIMYHIENITKKYGLDPRRFHDLVVLVESAKGGKNHGTDR